MQQSNISDQDNSHDALGEDIENLKQSISLLSKKDISDDHLIAIQKTAKEFLPEVLNIQALAGYLAVEQMEEIILEVLCKSGTGLFAANNDQFELSKQEKIERFSKNVQGIKRDDIDAVVDAAIFCFREASAVFFENYPSKRLAGFVMKIGNYVPDQLLEIAQASTIEDTRKAVEALKAGQAHFNDEYLEILRVIHKTAEKVTGPLVATFDQVVNETAKKTSTGFEGADGDAAHKRVIQNLMEAKITAEND